MFSLVSSVIGLGNHHLLLNVVLIKILLECFFCPYSKLSNCFRFSVKNLMPSRNADVSTRYDFENEQIGQGAVFGHDVCSHRFFYPFLHYKSLQLVWWHLLATGCQDLADFQSEFALKQWIHGWINPCRFPRKKGAFGSVFVARDKRQQERKAGKREVDIVHVKISVW